MTVRLLRPGEGRRAAELERACGGAAHWAAADYERIAAEAASPFCLLAEEDWGEVAGLLVASVAAPEAELLNLAVPPEKRRRGLATALLEEAVRRVAARGAAEIFLEVRESNGPAIAFYLRHGFQARGRRRDYYREPREDALVLARAVTPGSGPPNENIFS